MYYRYVIDICCSIGLIMGALLILPYKPFLMAKVRQHPDPKRAAVSFRRVKISIQDKSWEQGSLYKFIEHRYKWLNSTRIIGFIVVGSSIIMLILARVVH